jgi:transposase
MDVRRETDIEQLRRIALVQQTQIEQLLRVLKSQSRELEALKGTPDELQQTLALLETLTKKAQADLTSIDGTSGSPGVSSERKPRAKTGPTEQPALPIVPMLFELDQPDRVCPGCGGQLRPMKGQVEASEMIDVVEVSYRLVQVQQQKYVCRCGGCVETAPGPERAVAGSRYSLDFAIKVAIDKYLDHIPLARQARILKRHGVEITTQTLWGLLEALERRLRGADGALLERALASPVIGLDQTGWKRLDDKKSKPWQMWCVTAPGVVVHRIRSDKSADTFRDLVGGYRGVIVCDAAKTHEAGARDCEGILLVGCWAHVFRKFEEAAPDHPEAELARLDRRALRDRRARWRRPLREGRATSHGVGSSSGEAQGVALEPGGAQDAEHRQGRRLHDCQLGPAHAIRRRRGDPPRQQRDRARDPRARCRPPESLRLEVTPRYRGRIDHLLADRDGEAARRRSGRVPARDGARRRPRRDPPALEDGRYTGCRRLTSGSRTGSTAPMSTRGSGSTYGRTWSSSIGLSRSS